MTPFPSALEAHLAAIRERDLPALAATIADDLLLVGANGTVSTGRDEFLVRHEAWFASPSWTLATRTIHVRETDGTAIAVVHLRYRDPLPDPPVDETSILTLVFTRQGERWLMVHDQNTPIRA